MCAAETAQEKDTRVSQSIIFSQGLYSLVVRRMCISPQEGKGAPISRTAVARQH